MCSVIRGNSYKCGSSFKVKVRQSHADQVCSVIISILDDIPDEACTSARLLEAKPIYYCHLELEMKVVG